MRTAWRYTGGQYYLKSEQEMRDLFRYAQQAIDNTAKIADRCNVEIEFGKTKLPKFSVPDGYTSEQYLEKLCREGLVRRYGEEASQVEKRLDYELGVIKKMGYVDYFLIVWDFIHFSKIKRYNGWSGTRFSSRKCSCLQFGDNRY